MAWEYPKHACGHEGERVQMYGPNKDRERRLATIEREDCPACRAARADASCGELPPLIGSEKQVAWAAEMRANVLRDRAATIAAAGVPDDQVEAAARVLSAWARQTAARWWIDGRYSHNLATETAELIRRDAIAQKLSL